MNTASHLLAGRAPVAGVESCCGIRPGGKLELEQGLDGGTQASGGVCEEKGSRETHPSQGAFPRGHIHGRGRKRTKGRMMEEERDGIGTSSLPASSLSNLSLAPDALPLAAPVVVWRHPGPAC
jgi:hypothetical protein